MRVLICGGIKGINLVNAVRARFGEGSIEVDSVTNIEDIGAYLDKGNYFDRVVLMEQCWTHDGIISEAADMQKSMEQFVECITTKVKNCECVFVAASRYMAEIVACELFDIASISKIVVMVPPYIAKVIIDITTTDLKDIDGAMDISELSAGCSPEVNVNCGSTDTSTDITDVPKYGTPVDSVKEVEIEEVTEDEDSDSNMDDDGKFEFGLKLDEHPGYSETSEKLEDDFEIDDESIGIEELDEGTVWTNFDETVEETEDEEDILEDDSLVAELSGAIDEIEEEELDEETFATPDIFESFGKGFDDVSFEDDEASPLDGFTDNGDFEEDEIPVSLYENIEEDGVRDEDTYENEISIEEEENTNCDFDMLPGIDSGVISIDAENDGSGHTVRRPEFERNGLGSFGDTFDDVEIGVVSSVKHEEHKRDKSDGILSNFGDDMYNVEVGVASKNIERYSIPEIAQKRKKAKKVNIKVNCSAELKRSLDSKKKRGQSIIVTGASGSGKTTTAFNIANTLNKLGYTVLLVDMSTRTRGLTYMSSDVFEIIHSNDANNSSLSTALNSSASDLGNYVNIIRPALHMLCMGLGCDLIATENIAASKYTRFMNVAKSTYDFVVYEMPLEDIDKTPSIVHLADVLVMMVEATTRGLMNTIIGMGNIEDIDAQELIFKVSKICLNRVKESNAIFGGILNDGAEMLKGMDEMMYALVGNSFEYSFSALEICGALMESRGNEQFWFNDVQISDTEEGSQMFVRLIESIMG